MKLKSKIVTNIVAKIVILKLVDNETKDITHQDMTLASAIFHDICDNIGNLSYPNQYHINKIHAILRKNPYIKSRKENWGGYGAPINVYSLSDTKMPPREIINMRTSVDTIKSEICSLEKYIKSDASLQNEAYHSKITTNKLMSETVARLNNY